MVTAAPVATWRIYISSKEMVVSRSEFITKVAPPGACSTSVAAPIVPKGAVSSTQRTCTPATGRAKWSAIIWAR